MIAKNISAAQRLIITNIFMENFKSYFGRHRLGTFNPNLSCIIGPNGNGKSNIIDALLFVFGFSAKKIRSQKLSVLIHRPQMERHVNINSCRVDIEMGMWNGLTNSVNSAKFIISRVVNKNGNNHYELNGVAVGRNKILDLLSSYGIDLEHHRFLILQGEVEKISGMQSMDLIDYVEDAIGTIRFKKPVNIMEKLLSEFIEESSKRSLEETQSAIALKKLIENCQKVKMEIDERNEKNRKGFSYYRLMNFICTLQLKILKNRKQIEEKKKNESEKLMNEKQIELIRIENELKKLRMKKDWKTKELDEWKKKKMSLEKEMKKIERKLEEIHLTIVDCEKDILEYQEKLEELKKNEKDKEWKEYLNNKNELKLNLDEEINEERQKCQIEQMNEDKRLGSIGKEKLKMEEEYLSPLTNRLTQFNGNLQKLCLEKKRISSDIDVKELNEKIESLSFEIDKEENKIEIYREEMNELMLSIGKNDKNMEQMEKEFERIGKKKENLQIELEKLSNELGNAKEVQLTTRSSTGTDRVLKDAQLSGRINGFHGRLGELGSIDAPYDIAVSTAFGNLMNFVVNDMNCGRECVKILRENECGVSSFISLKDIEYMRRRMENQFQCPNKAKRLFDLVKFSDNRYRLPFYFVMGDTLVTDTLDDAKSIAYQSKQQNYRTRIVTMAGQLIEPSGSMSGGGRQKRGLMNLNRVSRVSSNKCRTKSITQKSNKELEVECENKKLEIGKLRGEFEFLEDKIGPLKIELESQRKLLKEHRQMIERINMTNEMKMKSLKEMERMKVKVDENQPKIDKFEKEIEFNEKELEFVKEEISKEKKKINDLFKTRLKPSEAIEEFNKRIETLIKDRLEIVNDMVKMTNMMEKREKEMKELERALKKSRKRLSNSNYQSEDLKNQLVYFEREWNSDVQQNLEEEQFELNENLNKLTNEHNYKSKEHKEEIEKMKNVNVKMEDVLKEMKIQKQFQQNLFFNFDKNFMEINHNLSDDNDVNGYRIFEEIFHLEAINEQFMEAYILLENHQLNETHKNFIQNDPFSARERFVIFTEIMEKLKIKNNSNGSNVISDYMKFSPQQDRENCMKLVEDERDNSIDIDYLLDIDEKEEIDEEEYLKLYDIETLENCLWMKKLGKISKELKGNKTINYSLLHSLFQKKVQYVRFWLTNSFYLLRKLQVEYQLDMLMTGRLKEFNKAISGIRVQLKRIYSFLTEGGDAELECINSISPFSDGLRYSVRPNRKVWRNMLMLSGGEKTLASLSLVFALHAFRPSPLYVMDEIDAALDFKNVTIIGQFVRKIASINCQFIIISLRSEMMEQSSVIIGIYKLGDQSNNVAILSPAYNCVTSAAVQRLKMSKETQLQLTESNGVNMDRNIVAFINKSSHIMTELMENIRRLRELPGVEKDLDENNDFQIDWDNLSTLHSSSESMSRDKLKIEIARNFDSLFIDMSRNELQDIYIQHILIENSIENETTFDYCQIFKSFVLYKFSRDTNQHNILQ
ncbi:hypothetical protein SNEBB_008727 [Seison nebaliae]|nr:hypothetical protein SNEBB_008727 [Seison nebaliae]